MRHKSKLDLYRRDKDNNPEPLHIINPTHSNK